MVSPPAKEDAITVIRASCASTRTHSGIALSEPKVDEFLRSLDPAHFARLAHTHGIRFPLKFDSVADEVNFLSVLALLNGLSGYRAEFHAATGSGVYDNILRLLVGLYLDADADIGADGDGAKGASRLSAKGLASLTSQTVSQIWGVNLMRETPHPTLTGITVGERSGEMVPPVDILVRTCNRTGEQLLQQGFPDLGTFVLHALRQGDQARSAVLARAKRSQSDQADQVDQAHQAEQVGLGATVHTLFALDGFADGTELDGEPVWLCKKIFFLLYSLASKFSSRQDFPLHLPSPRLLPMFVDNVIPTMLHQLGILDLSSCTREALRVWQRYNTEAGGATGKSVVPGPELSEYDGYALRAAALDAGAQVVQRARALASEGTAYSWMASMTEAELDGFLWSGAKDDPALRRVPRMVQRDTIMF